MANGNVKMYNASDYGKKEVEMMRLYPLQRDDAKNYFTNCILPRLNRSYKLYISDNTDRAKQIKKWQANVSVPYIHGVVETLKPRILDARPEFNVQGRNVDDQAKASKIQALSDFTWEIAGADNTAESVTSSALIYGMGYMQVSWKKDVRTSKFLKTKDIAGKKYTWEKETKTFYDAPYVEWVDNFNLWYDWHNTEEENKQYWFKRFILPEEVIKRRYPMADKKRLDIAFASSGGDLTDYGSIRTELKGTQESITKGADKNGGSGGTTSSDKYSNSDLKMYEVLEWLRPFEDKYAVMVNDVPILKGGSMPNPYNFKASFFIGTPYLKIPGEYEGYGLPMILENSQIMLNMIKNQRLDATTLSIHKMWIVNPLANINKNELVMRPFGIVYSTDPNGAREVQMGDIKASAYKEDELLKADMRQASGVDDASMGAGGGAQSATEVRHLRESTLERVRLFVNHLGDSYAKMQRYWISMWQQFYTEEIIIRITGDDGVTEFPIIEEDDLMGQYDFKSTVIPSIAGQNDIKKKQDMDLFQLLVEMPFVDPEKLTSKMLHDWSWNIQSIKKEEQEAPPMEGMMPGEEGAPPEGMPPEGGSPAGIERAITNGQIPVGVANGIADLLSKQSVNPMAELSKPVNLAGKTPPTVAGVKGKANTRGMNRKVGGKVNTNVAQKAPNTPDAQLANRVNNIQK